MKSLSDSVYKIPLKAQEAAFSRDSLAKAVYAKLFDWLVRCVNTSLRTSAATRAFIGVLDIFGFEQFETNSFEQLCINFANEMLQAHFNTAVFSQEQESESPIYIYMYTYMYIYMYTYTHTYTHRDAPGTFQHGSIPAGAGE